MAQATKAQATATLKAVEATYKAWIAASPEYGPKIIKYEGEWAIAWEDGAPYQWALDYSGGTYIDEEFGFKVTVIDPPDSVFAEAYNGYVLTVYPA